MLRSKMLGTATLVGVVSYEDQNKTCKLNKMIVNPFSVFKLTSVYKRVV